MQSNPTPLTNPDSEPIWQSLADIVLPSQPGSDHLAGELIAAILPVVNLSSADIEPLKIGITMAMLSAIEHDNRFQRNLPITIRVLISAKTITISNTDQIREPILEPGSPNLAVNEVRPRSSRGWGFFLIEKMMDDFRISRDEACRHTIELFLYLEGGGAEEVS